MHERATLEVWAGNSQISSIAELHRATIKVLIINKFKIFRYASQIFYL